MVSRFPCIGSIPAIKVFPANCPALSSPKPRFWTSHSPDAEGCHLSLEKENDFTPSLPPINNLSTSPSSMSSRLWVRCMDSSMVKYFHSCSASGGISYAITFTPAPSPFWFPLPCKGSTINWYLSFPVFTQRILWTVGSWCSCMGVQAWVGSRAVPNSARNRIFPGLMFLLDSTVPRPLLLLFHLRRCLWL